MVELKMAEFISSEMNFHHFGMSHKLEYAFECFPLHKIPYILSIYS